jgi:hypothetical protein
MVADATVFSLASFVEIGEENRTAPAAALRVSADHLTHTCKRKLDGPMSEVFLGLWGNGMTVERNPFEPALFRSGIVRIRVVVSCGVRSRRQLLHSRSFRHA